MKNGGWVYVQVYLRGTYCTILSFFLSSFCCSFTGNKHPADNISENKKELPIGTKNWRFETVTIAHLPR